VLRIAMLALAVAISTAQAQEPRTVIHPTNFSCGTWINTPKNTAQHEQLKSWVLGYLSGDNIQSSVDFLRGRDADALTVWIDNYCRRNPLHEITRAMVELVKELKAGR